MVFNAGRSVLKGKIMIFVYENFFKKIFLLSLIHLVLFMNILISKPYVTCHLSGQLGNQLYQIATTLAYAWDNNADPIFPDLNRKDLNIPINCKRVFYRLNKSSLPRPVAHT